MSLMLPRQGVGAQYGMRWLLASLIALLASLQIPLWLGDGSFRDLRLLNQAIGEQQSENLALQVRNRALEAEVSDLKNGFDAIEERARTNLGMTREGETFFHLLPSQPDSQDGDAR